MNGITLPAVQTYVHESFGEGAFPMIAVTRHTEDDEFHFKNICGALKLQLTGSAVVKEVKLTGNAAERLSGKAIVYGFKDNLSPQIQMQEDASESVTLDCGSRVSSMKLHDCIHIGLASCRVRKGLYSNNYHC